MRPLIAESLSHATSTRPGFATDNIDIAVRADPIETGDRA